VQPFASGKNARAACDRCGRYYRLPELKGETYKQRPVNNRVCPDCFDPDHPQLMLGTFPINDPQAVRDPRPDSTYTLSGLDSDGYTAPGSRAFPQAWNEDDMASGLSLDTYASLVVTTNATAYKVVRSQNSHTAGKFYWQAYLYRGTAPAAGFATADAVLTTQLGTDDQGFGLYVDGVALHDNESAATGLTWGAGTWVRFAIDFDEGKVWVGDESGWVGDPEAGSDETWTFTAGAELYAAAMLYDSTDMLLANFGSTRQFNTAPAGFNPF
jgi:hypothetical protein